ncbi:MAG: translation initiation factor IF-2 associated domain-containing protein, partial [Pseudomonadota bacterium]
MTETKDSNDKTIRGGGRKPLSLQRTVESGHVQQNFSHGRKKSVLVEKRKTRKLAQPGSAPEAEAKATPAPATKAVPKPKPDAVSGASAAKRSTAGASGQQPRGQVLKTLSDEERDARSRALAAAKQRDQVEAVQQAEQAKAEAAEKARRDAEAAEAEKADAAKAKQAKSDASATQSSPATAKSEQKPEAATP